MGGSSATVKDELHALVDRLGQEDAHDALDYLRSRVERLPKPSQAFVKASRQALDEAVAPHTTHVPHEAVRAWLATWGTSQEGAAAEELRAIEERLHRDA